MNQLSTIIRQIYAGATLPQVTQVRFRYHADKLARGPFLRRYGYDDKLLQRGALPRRKEDDKPLPMPMYKPKNSWSEKRAVFGQNDYIDILGSEDIHPVQVMYHLPKWLRGARGNEFQMLIRKKKAMHDEGMHETDPIKWKNMNLRIKWLHEFLNCKTKTTYPDKPYWRIK